MGIIRILLALIVAGDHFTVHVLLKPGLTNDGIQQWIYMNAGFAVMFFYVISGFLISYALSNKYQDGWWGTLRFFRGRVARIFSLYWPLLLVSLIFLDGHAAPWSARDILVNIFLLGGDWVLAFQGYPNEMSPFPHSLLQAWTLSAELTFYFLAPFVLRSFTATIALVVFSLVTRISLEHVFDFHQAWNYHFFPSALWFFLIGHLSRKIYSMGFTKSAKTSVILFIASLILIMGTRHGGFVSIWFYSSIICFALALPGIFEATKNDKVMNFMGDLSYPVYLIHLMLLWQFAPVGSIGYLFEMAKRGTPFPLVICAFLVVVLLVSIASHFLIERPCAQGLRKLFRLQSTRTLR